MKPYLYSLIAAAAAIGFASAQTATTDPVGYMTVPIPGTGGGNDQLQLANQGLLPSGPAAAGGGVTVTYSGSTLTDTAATFAPGAFVNGSPLSHVLEITSGTLQGAMTWITSNGATTITTSDSLASAEAGSTYRVWKAWTISTLLGNPPTDAVLKPAGDVATADNVQIYDPTTDQYKTFFYKTATKVAPAAWQCSDPAILNPANYAIHPNDGLLFLRKQVGDGSLVVTGSVKTGQTKILIQGNPAPNVTTLNIVANQVPVNQVTLNTSNLFTGDPATGMKAAGDVASADNLLVYDPGTDSYTTFFYKTATKVAPAAWQASDPAIVNPGAYVLPSEKAILIQRKSGASFSWTVPSVTITP